MPWWKSLLIRVIAIAVVTMLFTGENPLNVFSAMISGSFGTSRKIWATLQGIAILLCVSLAVTPAFRMRFWNVGGEGQILMGGLACAACMIYFGDVVPNWVLILMMTVSAIVAGAIWGGIPAIFKAKWNTNETLFTLMMNYIATQLVAYFCNIWDKKGSGIVGVINPATEAGWFPVLGGQRYLLNVIIVAILVVFVYIYLNYSKHGYELTVVGESEKTARYVGIKVEKVIVRTMLLSGALCGVAGLLLVGGTNHTLTTSIVDGRGFTPQAWGIGDWRQRTHLLEAGHHTLCWRYSKDASRSQGEDCVWIDDIQLPLAAWADIYAWDCMEATVGIEEPSPTIPLTISPNPASGEAVISGARDTRVRVADESGKSVGEFAAEHD